MAEILNQTNKQKSSASIALVYDVTRFLLYVVEFDLGDFGAYFSPLAPWTPISRGEISSWAKLGIWSYFLIKKIPTSLETPERARSIVLSMLLGHESLGIRLSFQYSGQTRYHRKTNHFFFFFCSVGQKILRKKKFVFQFWL